MAHGCTPACVTPSRPEKRGAFGLLLLTSLFRLDAIEVQHEKRIWLKSRVVSKATAMALQAHRAQGIFFVPGAVVSASWWRLAAAAPAIDLRRRRERRGPAALARAERAEAGGVGNGFSGN